MPEKQLAEQKTDSIRATLIRMQGEFKDALPKLLTPERFTRVALTCINKNPKLLACTRESLLACLLDCASLGIEPDGRRAHLIPYGDKCTLIIDYKGIAELVRRSGEVSDLHSDIVCENDDFDYMFGTGSFLRHKIDIRKERGAVIGAYSYVKLKDGAESFDVMGVAEIEVIRKRSKAANNGPWVTDKGEMQKKTVFRRHSKWLPLSPELRDKIEVDDEALTEEERFQAARPVSDIQLGAALPEKSEAVEEPQPETPDATEEKKPARKKNEEKPAPPRATPVEVVKNLMLASKIDGKDVMTELFAKQKCQQGDTLEKLPEETITWLIDNWMTVAADIKGE